MAPPIEIPDCAVCFEPLEADRAAMEPYILVAANGVEFRYRLCRGHFKWVASFPSQKELEEYFVSLEKVLVFRTCKPEGSA